MTRSGSKPTSGRWSRSPSRTVARPASAFDGAATTDTGAVLISTGAGVAGTVDFNAGLTVGTGGLQITAGTGNVDFAWLAARIPSTAARTLEIDQHEPDEDLPTGLGVLREAGF